MLLDNVISMTSRCKNCGNICQYNSIRGRYLNWCSHYCLFNHDASTVDYLNNSYQPQHKSEFLNPGSIHHVEPKSMRTLFSKL